MNLTLEQKIDEILINFFNEVEVDVHSGNNHDGVVITKAGTKAKQQLLSLLEEEKKVTGDTSDGYHTFNELYDFRKVFNAVLFNEWAEQGKYKVHKSKKHSDGELCFGGGWFIVVAELPTGQISNHYELNDWDLFRIPETPIAHAFDGHTSQDVLDRLQKLNQLNGDK